MTHNKSINLYEILKQELAQKDYDWNIIEKALYVFKRTCQIFNYDERWYSTLGSGYLGKSLLNQKLDMKDIKNVSIICSGWSYLYCDLANALFKDEENYDKTILYTEEEHHYVILLTKDNKKLLLDPISPGDDFLNVSRGFPIRGIEYYDDADSVISNNQKINASINQIMQDYSCSYLDYLELVKKELKGLYQTNKLINIPYEELNNIFRYVIETTNLQDLGLLEANSLILKTLTTILEGNISIRGFKRNQFYGNACINSYIDLLVPKNSEELEIYQLKRESDRDISIKRTKTLKKDELY